MATLLPTGLRADIKPTIRICEKTCSCPAPLLPLESEYNMAPSKKDTKTKTVQCGLDAGIFGRGLECVQELGISPSAVCPAVSGNGSRGCLDSISSFMPETYLASYKAPKDCGYTYNNPDVKFTKKSYEEVVKGWKENEVISCEGSMCISATFLALAAHAKKQFTEGKISRDKYEELTTPFGKAYSMLNEATEPNELVETYGIGTGHIQHVADGELGKDGLPAPGDIVQIWRKNSGHSAIFKGFLDEDNDGKPDRMCYWSSQSKTKGYGHQCEKIKYMKEVRIGHLE